MTIESYFSSKDDLRSIILEQLDSAQRNIFIAVAWFTDTLLFNKLLKKQQEGVHIEVIVTQHEFNNRIDFNVLRNNGGLFLEVGDESYYMHNKFCVIDYQVVINGSFNWTKRANTANIENITVIEGNNQLALSFINEFEVIKKTVGVTYNSEEEELSKIIKYFQLFKSFSAINEPEKIVSYLHELKRYESINHITTALLEERYYEAIIAIDDYLKKYSQLADYSAAEKAIILSQIKLLEYQIEILLIEKGEVENKISQFNHRCVIELNPIILKILALKRKIYAKLKKHGIKENPFEKVEENFQKANDQYEKEKDVEIEELDESDTETIKERYRKAVRLCHPDSPHCIFKDQQKASDIFNALTTAYKHNDLEQLSYLVQELELKNIDVSGETKDTVMLLKAKLATLKEKYKNILTNIEQIKISEEYQLILQYKDLDQYFIEKKIELEANYLQLNENYTRP